MNGEEKVAVSEVSREDLRWVNKRIDRLNKKIRLIIALLVDKKIIGVELAKRIEESKASGADLIDWLMSTIEEK